MTNEEFAASKDWLDWDRPTETLKRVPGTSPLDSAQSEWYRAHFGYRYLSVQEQPQRPSRRWRRLRRKEDLG